MCQGYTSDMHKEKVLALLRIALGSVFLWGFLDKTFGLGFSTPVERSWLAGSSPTSGFLSKGTEGPFGEMFAGMAGSVAVDWLFMMGLLGVGLALVLGMGMFVAAWAGSAQMLLIYLSMFPPTTHPVVDQHVIYILCFWVLWYFKAGEVWGLGKWWKRLEVVKKNRWLV